MRKIIVSLVAATGVFAMGACSTGDSEPTVTVTKDSSTPVVDEVDAIGILANVWDETSYADRTAICDGYWIDSNLIVNTLIEGNEAYITYDEADDFLFNNC